MNTTPNLATTPALLLALCCAAFTTVSSLPAATILGGNGDVEIREDGVLNATNVQTIRAGSSSGTNPGGRNALFIFQMPNLGMVANPFTTADLNLTFVSYAPVPGTGRVDLYGLGVQASSTLAVGSGALSTAGYYEGDVVDPAATLIQADYVVATAVPNTTYGLDGTGSLALTSYLNSVYNSGATIGQYVVFRLNPDVNYGNATFGYNFATSENSTAAYRPVLNYTAVPEPTAAMLVGLSAMGVLLYRRRRS